MWRRAEGRDADDAVWVDPMASAFERGLDEQDPRVTRLADGREVRTLFEASLLRQARRLVRHEATHREALVRLLADDVAAPEGVR